MKGSSKPSARSGYLPRPKREKITSGKKKGKNQEPKIACTEARYNGWTCSSGHAEGKIIQDLFSKAASPGGTLTIRVRWRKSQRIMRDDPCNACRYAICQTAACCNLKIELCVTSGNKINKETAPCTSDGTWDSNMSQNVW
jgi:hypothetical protein